MKYYSFYFGQAYGEGLYSRGSYSCTTEQQAAGQCDPAAAGQTGNNSALANTGLAVSIFVTLACLIVFVTLIVRFLRRKPALQAAPATTTESHQEQPKRQG